MSYDDKCSNMLLNLVSDMFRQHGKLFSEQKNVLERLVSQPHAEESWRMGEEDEEEKNSKLKKEIVFRQKVSELAKKSHEGMLEVQDRINYLENVLEEKTSFNKLDAKREIDVDKLKLKISPSNPLYWLERERGSQLLKEALEESPDDDEREAVAIANTKLRNLWNTMNSTMRQPYIEKARSVPNDERGVVLNSNNMNRGNYRSMKKRKSSYLDSTDDTNSYYKDRWEKKYKLLRKFHDREGHGNVHHDHEEEGIKLGVWVRLQRVKKKRGRLDPTLERRLEDLGVILNLKEKYNESITNFELRSSMEKRLEDMGIIQNSRRKKRMKISDETSNNKKEYNDDKIVIAEDGTIRSNVEMQKDIGREETKYPSEDDISNKSLVELDNEDSDNSSIALLDKN